MTKSLWKLHIWWSTYNTTWFMYAYSINVSNYCVSYCSSLFTFEIAFNKDVKEPTIFLNFTLQHFIGEVTCYISIYRLKICWGPRFSSQTLTTEFYCICSIRKLKNTTVTAARTWALEPGSSIDLCSNPSSRPWTYHHLFCKMRTFETYNLYKCDNTDVYIGI